MTEQCSHPSRTYSSIAGGEHFKLWAGKGTGRVCAQCRKPVVASDIEYEIADAATSPSAAMLTFHVRCFDEWRARRSTNHANGISEQGG
jgi:hypothetical protein